MALQTVFVTNRNVNVGKSSKKHVFGNGLDTQGNIHFAQAVPLDKTKIRRYKVGNKIPRTHTSIKKTYQLTRIDPQNHARYLSDIVAQSDNGKPWVFFLHGNNQTLSKNLVKSRRIQEEYDVNLIIFSWPSCSYQPKFLPLLFLGTGLALNPPTKEVGKWIAKKAVKRKIKQYRTARKMAEKTALDFGDAFEMIKQNLLLPMQASHNPHTCFLIHSLGGRVVRKIVEGDNQYFNDYHFNTCMLHQIDEEDRNHQQWASALPFVENSNTYITRNKKDLILLLAGVVNNHFDVNQAFTRLGNRWHDDSEAGSPLQYIDFTPLDDLGLVGHGIAWDAGRSDEVDGLCRPILTGV